MAFCLLTQARTAAGGGVVWRVAATAPKSSGTGAVCNKRVVTLIAGSRLGTTTLCASRIFDAFGAKAINQLADMLGLVQCQISSAGLATAWRLSVARPFKGGLLGDAHQFRGLKPSATLSRHYVTHAAPKLSNFR